MVLALQQGKDQMELGLGHSVRGRGRGLEPGSSCDGARRIAMNRVVDKCPIHRDFVVQRCSPGCINKDVWSWRPDAGVKFVRRKLLRGDGGKKARSPRRARNKP